MDVLKYLTNCNILSTVTQEEDEKEWLTNRIRVLAAQMLVLYVV